MEFFLISCIRLNDRMNDELEVMWKGAAIDQLVVLSQHPPGQEPGTCSTQMCGHRAESYLCGICKEESLGQLIQR
jgi:hypothetical protein